MANRTRVLYVGRTSDLMRRVWQHQNGLIPGFTRKYNIKCLVYFEETGSAISSIARERQVKGWVRAKKLLLIEAANPQWRDLAERWFEV